MNGSQASGTAAVGEWANAPASDGSGSDCTFCQEEPAEYFRLPTKLGTLADLCRTCANQYSARPTKMRTVL